MTSPSPDPAVRISVFGGFRVWHRGDEITTLTSRQRTVLAQLVAANGNVVRLGELIDTLWVNEPPGTKFSASSVSSGGHWIRNYPPTPAGT